MPGQRRYRTRQNGTALHHAAEQDMTWTIKPYRSFQGSSPPPVLPQDLHLAVLIPRVPSIPHVALIEAPLKTSLRRSPGLRVTGLLECLLRCADAVCELFRRTKPPVCGLPPHSGFLSEDLLCRVAFLEDRCLELCPCELRFFECFGAG